eukprot:47115-Eustigmatos_ZCMA.PRE.1
MDIHSNSVLPSSFLPLFLVLKMRHVRNRRPSELRMCDKCDRHTVQDEEHVLLDCPNEHLVSLRSQHQLFFPSQSEVDTTRLRDFINQPNVSGVASFAFLQASAQMPPRGIYSDVTLPYLTLRCDSPVFNSLPRACCA